MDNQRFILIAALSLILFFLWQAWDKQHLEAPVTPTTATSPAQSVPSVPTLSTPGNQAASAAPSTEPSRGQRISITTDLLQAQIDTSGGDLRQLSAYVGAAKNVGQVTTRDETPQPSGHHTAVYATSRVLVTDQLAAEEISRLGDVQKRQLCDPALQLGRAGFDV